jgi:lipopolysaccharide export system protein LptC
VSVELHLPDLPEVPISLGPVAGAPARPAVPWHLRLRDGLSSYLPLLLLALLALATWWLAKNSPRGVAAPAERPLSTEPDYTMNQFALERFDAAGRLKLRIEGASLRHIPATDRIEIDEVQISAYAPDGSVTLAHARRALGNGDGSELQLLGGAEVTSPGAAGGDLVMRSEFLHAFTALERIKSHLPVLVRQGGTEMTAAGLDYDHGARLLELKGPLRIVLAAPARKVAPR